MKPFIKYLIFGVLLCLLVEVRAPPPDEGKITQSNQLGEPNNPQMAKDTQNVENSIPSNAEKNKGALEGNKENSGATPQPIPPSPTPTTDYNCTNITNCEEGVTPSIKQMLTSMLSENKGMITRSVTVLIGVTVIVIAYFVMRAVRLRKRSKTKKYGVISSRDADLEMRPLEEDDDDDDVTVFDVNGVDDFRSMGRR